MLGKLTSDFGRPLRIHPKVDIGVPPKPVAATVSIDQMGPVSGGLVFIGVRSTPGFRLGRATLWLFCHIFGGNWAILGSL